MLAKAAVGTLAVFLFCIGWLYVAWSHGNKSLDWVQVKANITGVSEEETLLPNAMQRRKFGGFVSTIEYQFDGVDFEAKLPEYKLGEIEVFVNPFEPTEVVAERGATMVTLARPIIGTVGSGLFAIVLVLICFSPKEE